MVSAAQWNVTFCPALEEMRSGESVVPNTERPISGLRSHAGKSTPISASERLPTGVSETLPVWSVLIVSRLPAMDEGTCCVAESISAVMSEAS